ncbi:MAG: septal ring lytic transglycosylase RlpA family protein [Rhodospirillales bacterium]|nr:septal ring lytic transglycosylase RlpA family protein [Rhodospirillales bacterium]
MKRLLLICTLLLTLTGCSELQLASHVTKQAMPPSKSQGTFKVGSPYKIDGRRYYPQESYDYSETGIASWYGPNFHGKSTANGETFDENELTAAHKTLQMPSLVRVTNLENGRSLIVRVNDRGPYSKGRIIDVSKRAAELLGFRTKGTAKVRLDVLEKESLAIAQAAKSGKDTSGYEVALNRGGTLPDEGDQATRVAYGGTPPVESVSREALVSAPYQDGALQQAIPGHTKNGNFYPDPVVTEMPITPTDIYVQAGSFTVADNAHRLKSKLQQFAATDVFPAVVNGRQFYRVRLGPVETVAQADRLLSQILSAGNESAIIVVESR